MIGVLVRRREDTETQRRMKCEDEGKDWSQQSICQGTPRIAGNHQKLGEKHGSDSPSEPLEEANLTDTLILDFWTSEL